MSTEIQAEMAANVWQVVAREGDTLQEGDTVVVLESTDLEFPVFAGVSGVLTQLMVTEGDDVREGDVIAVIG